MYNGVCKLKLMHHKNENWNESNIMVIESSKEMSFMSINDP